MKNPDKYVRAGWITLISNVTGLVVKHNMLPKDINPYPSEYVLLSGQVTTERLISKPDASMVQYWGKRDLNHSLQIDFYKILPQGFNSPVTVENYVESVLTAVANGQLVIHGYSIRDVQFIENRAMPTENETQNIDRKIVVVQHWLSEK